MNDVNPENAFSPDVFRVVCPVCETDRFVRLDRVAGSGKCVNKHHVMRRDDGVWYCPDIGFVPSAGGDGQ